MAKCEKGGRCNWRIIDRPRPGEANIVLEQCSKCTRARERRLIPIEVIIIMIMILVAILFWALINWR